MPLAAGANYSCRMVDDDLAPDDDDAADVADEDAADDTADDHDELTLDALSAAYAGVSAGERAAADAADRAPAEDESQAAAPAFDDEVASADDAVEPTDDELGEVTPSGILEALLFVGDPESKPLTARQIAALMRGFSPREVDELVVELNANYAERGCPYEIVSLGAGYVMRLREQYEAMRDRFLGRVRDAKLSQQAIDVLAIVAYRQPILRDEVEKIRGKPSGSVLSQLVRRQLLRVEQSDGKPRRPKYFTTDRFLKIMGLDALGELPRSQDFDVKSS